MTDHLTRRDFVTAASALAGAALLPAAATAGRAPVGAAVRSAPGWACPPPGLRVGEPSLLEGGGVAVAGSPDRAKVAAAPEGAGGGAGRDSCPPHRVFTTLPRRAGRQSGAADGFHPAPA